MRIASTSVPDTPQLPNATRHAMGKVQERPWLIGMEGAGRLHLEVEQLYLLSFLPSVRCDLVHSRHRVEWYT